MKKIILSLIFVVLATAVALAQSPREEITMNPKLSASSHFAYPYNDANLPALTATPAGYEAFYIDHYGRHGSRWLSSTAEYLYPVLVLQEAQRQGKLTDRGERLLVMLQAVNTASNKREGELSDVGAEQHQAIARRMVKNFPEVFANNPTIDAKSSVIIRCILSMMNETNTIKSLCPDVKITTDASEHDMHYIAYGHGEDTCANALKKYTNKKYPNKANELDPTAFYGRIFNDVEWAKEFCSHSYAVDNQNTLIPVDPNDKAVTKELKKKYKGLFSGKDFMWSVFNLAGALQNHHQFDGMDIYNYFTSEELYQLWKAGNVYWYIRYGNSPLNGNRMPFVERELAQNLIESADAALASGIHGANLRFGHDTMVMPLTCLLELGDYGKSYDDLTNLDQLWQNYRIIPMAANIQLIFYRKVGTTKNNPEDVLVKAMLNEHEISLPVNTDKYPYYKWSDVRNYWVKKLATPIDWKVK